MTPYNQARYSCNAGHFAPFYFSEQQELLRDLLWGAQQLDVVLQTHLTPSYTMLYCAQTSLQNKLAGLAFQLLQSLDLHLHNLQHRKLVLTPDGLDPSLSPLRLLLDHHRPAVHSEHSHPALEQSLVQVIRLTSAFPIV